MNFLTIHAFEAFFLIVLCTVTLIILLVKITKESPIVTTNKPPLGDHNRWMIDSDRKQFYFSSRSEMDAFRSGIINPYEMWEQDDRLHWHYLGGCK
jgi:hypothetical protein